MRRSALLPAALMLAALLSQSAVEGARRPTFKGCNNLSAIRDPELGAAVKLIKNLGLLPAGVPFDFTLFLPTNASLEEVLVGGPIPTPSSDLDVILSKPLIPEIAYRLNAVFLYHLANIGAATVGDLLDEERVPTVLGADYTLTFGAGEGRKMYNVTDVTGRVASANAPRSVCGSTLFKIDKVMLPAKEFADIPLVDPLEAMCLLTGMGCRVGAEWVNSPSGGQAPAPTPAPA